MMMKPTAYLITCDRYLPNVCLAENLERAMDERGPLVVATPLYSAQQIGCALMRDCGNSGRNSDG